MRKTLLLLIALIAFNQLYSSASKIIDLKGKWAFTMDQNDQGLSEKWFSKKLNDSIKLPGSMVENLKGFDIDLKTKFTGSIYDSSWYFNPKMEKYRQPGNIKMPFWLTQLKHYVGLAWYQKEVVIPSSWKGENEIHRKYLRQFLVF